jgi:hypothetical protein
MYKNHSLSYDELLISNKCLLYINNDFVIMDINKNDDYILLTGLMKDCDIQIKINDKKSFDNLKINKYYGH